MNKRKLGWPLVLLVAGAAACSSYECGDLCAELTACPEADGQLDCGALCSAAERINEAGRCGTYFDSYLECMNDAAACDAGVCSTERAVWASCGLLHCQTNPSDPDCIALSLLFS